MSKIAPLARLFAILALFLAPGLVSVSSSQDRYGPLQWRSFGLWEEGGTISPSGMIEEMIGQVNRERALSDLRRMTGEQQICTSRGCYNIVNRLTGSQGLQWAMDYISEKLPGLGYSVELANWSRAGYSGQNLIARKPGLLAPAQQVYVVAHVDGVASGPEERFPAADDNASGAVALLEVARVLSNYSFGRTVVLFFSTGEEQGSLGSKAYMDQLAGEQVASIMYVIDVDMVGYDANRDAVMELWSGDHAPSLALTRVMSETLHTYQLGLVPQIVSGCT